MNPPSDVPSAREVDVRGREGPSEVVFELLNV